MEAKNNLHLTDLGKAIIRIGSGPGDKLKKGVEETFDHVIGSFPNTYSGCRIRIELTQIQYYGKNLGQNWMYKLSIDGEPVYQYKGCHLRGEIRYPHKLVYDRLIEGDCESPIKLLLSGFAIEGDEIQDIKGSNLTQAMFCCRHDCLERDEYVGLEVCISDKNKYWFGSRTAKLIFSFKVSIECYNKN